MDVPVLFLAVGAVLLSQGQGARDLFPLGSTVEDIMNTCMDGMNHKSKPGPESNLYKHCTSWSKRSCCTEKTQGIAYDRTWLNFNWHHCGDLSPLCNQQFIKDLCFYECSPNVGPYLVPDKRKIRTERFRDVPLCQRTCDDWWDACKSDITCIDNWTQNFNWSTGINTCPTGSKCETFQKVFGNASNFCESVYDRSFKVVPDSEDCFRLWFSPDENPNEKVARRAAERLQVLLSSTNFVSSAPQVVFLALAVSFLYVYSVL